jgi:hypothetical protein
MHQLNRSRLRRAMLAGAGSLLAAAAVSGPAIAAPANDSRAEVAPPLTYTYTTLDDQADLTFNQLLGINDRGVVAGYYGSGVPAITHPNKGYVLDPPYGQGNYVNENFGGSQQTQVTGINNKGETVGFWADTPGDNFGFVDRGGIFTDVVDPHGQGNAGSGMTTEQLLGVNDENIAVGFWTDANGNDHGFLYNVRRKSFTEIGIPGSPSVTTTAINDDGKVAGFYVGAQGQPVGFIRSSRGQITVLPGPQQQERGRRKLHGCHGRDARLHLDPAGRVHDDRRPERHEGRPGDDGCQRGQRPRSARRLLPRRQRQHRRPARHPQQLTRFVARARARGGPGGARLLGRDRCPTSSTCHRWSGVR